MWYAEIKAEPDSLLYKYNCKGKFKQLLYYSKDLWVDGLGRIQFLRLGLLWCKKKFLLHVIISF